LISSGYRNEYDIAIDPNGELFTYDADMEWDIGAPWYRPTRVCHAVHGSEFGWRSGNYKWPDYFADSLPSVVDIGPGSPTGIVFGTGARYPAKYQRALFICDWSYGKLYAVHLTPEGAAFRGEAELFCSAPALQAADIVVGGDGALYFVTGGRKTASSLFRIDYRGNDSTAPAAPQPPNQAALLRRQLEDLQIAPPDQAAESVAMAWPHLSNPDRWIRYAARTAIEHQPVDAWLAKIPTAADPWETLESTMALARAGKPSQWNVALEALGRLNWEALSEQQRLHLIRDYALLFLRGQDQAKAVADAAIARLNDKFPCQSHWVDRELCRMLAAAGSKDLVPRAMKLLRSGSTQEEQIHYAAMLRVCRDGWTPELRRAYFHWFVSSANLAGGNSFGGYLKAIRDEALAALADSERESLKDVLAAQAEPTDPYAELKARPVVQEWKVGDLAKNLKDELTNRDFDNGKKLFTLAQCFKCHRMEGQGGYVGPDLAGIGRRYSRLELLESLIEPNKVISDQFQSTKFVLTNGKTVTGRVVNLSGNAFLVQTDMLNPGNLTAVDVDQIEERSPSKVSMMPEGLLNTLTKHDILDLMAYLRSGGDRNFEELRRK
jgi:putative heme-binding domain-containing protein